VKWRTDSLVCQAIVDAFVVGARASWTALYFSFVMGRCKDHQLIILAYEPHLIMMQQCKRLSVQVHTELLMEAALPLVSGNWPVLETLTVTFTHVNEQVVNTIVTGDWPMLKELHIEIENSAHHWDRHRVDSWQTIEQGCYDVCKTRWPGLKVKLPDAKELQMRLDRQEQRTSWVNLQAANTL